MLGEAKLQDMAKGALKIEYEPEVDILMLYLQDPETSLNHSTETEPGVLLNYTGNGSLASVEILDASKRYSPGQLAASSVDELIDLKKASSLAGVAPVTLRTQVEKGKLWALRLGGHWVTSRERLQQYLESLKRRTN